MGRDIDANSLAPKTDIILVKDYLDMAFYRQRVAFGLIMFIGISLITAVIKFL